MKTKETYQLELEKARRQAVELERKIEQLEAEEKDHPQYRLARALHECFCNYNHTDGCSWLYEVRKDCTEDWSGWAHDRYLRKAKAMIEKFGEEDCKKFIDMIKAYRESV